MQKSLILLIIIFFIGSLCQPIHARTDNSRKLSFNHWVDRVIKQAQTQGISEQTLNSAFSNIKQINTSNLDKPLPSDELLGNTLTPRQIRINRRLVNHYSDVLFEIKHLFGVNPEVIIALWATDNIQNQNKPHISAIDRLTSLSYSQPSNKKIKSELFQALKIIDDGQISTQQFQSNLDGSLGSTPFNPTSYRDYAIDYDGDGKYDVWKNYADIFASSANYLSSIGWQSGEPWGYEIKLPADFKRHYIGLNQQRKLSQWQDYGVRLASGADLPNDPEKMGSIMQISSGEIKSFLVFDNYFALLRWKRSQTFAFAVGLMVDKIKQPTDADPIAPFANISE